MYTFPYNGKAYAPWVRIDGRIELWGTARYGQGAQKGSVVLTAKVLVLSDSGRRGSRRYAVPAEEVVLPQPVEHKTQQQVLDTMMLAVATRAGYDFTERYPKALTHSFKRS